MALTQGSAVHVNRLEVITQTQIPILQVGELMIEPGERVGIVGPSGVGKSTLARAMVGEVAVGLQVRGRVSVDRIDLMGSSPAELRRLRRRSIAYVHQQPASSLNPAQRVGSAVAERLPPASIWGSDRRLRRETFGRVQSLLETMGLPTDRAFLRRRTHQLSGGQAQRLALARALANDPSLIVLDEPTTDLDAASKAQVLDLIGRVAAGATLVVVSHDHATIDALADRVVSIRDGRLAAQVERNRRGAGDVSGAVSGRRRPTRLLPRRPLLEVTRLSATYQRGREEAVPAVVDASLQVGAGEVVALVGPSGSGKTTLARCLVGSHGPYQGEIRLDGAVVEPHGRRRAMAHRRAIQLIPQDPGTTLNIVHRVGDIVHRPAQVLRGLSSTSARALAHTLLDAVGLPRSVWSQRAGTLSGGERQRVAIARALAAGPRLLVCDEITSALDDDSAGRVLDLVVSLIEDDDLAVILISHDHTLVSGLADAVVGVDDGHVSMRLAAASDQAR